MRRREETSQRPLRGIIEPTVTVTAVVVFAGDDVKLRGEVFVRRWRRPSRKLHVIVFLFFALLSQQKIKKSVSSFKKKKKFCVCVINIFKTLSTEERAFGRYVRVARNSRRSRVLQKFNSLLRSFLIYLLHERVVARMKKPSLFFFFFFIFFFVGGVEKVLLAGIDSEVSSELSPPQRERRGESGFFTTFFSLD